MNLVALFLFVFTLVGIDKPVDALKKSYIVYLGAHPHTRENVHLIDHEGITDSHHELLGSIVGCKDKARETMFYSYTKFINGFAALLEEDEAESLRKHPDIISVSLDRRRSPTTAHVWEALGLEDVAGHVPEDSLWKKTNYGNDAIIGIVDTGIWPESKSFNDEGLGPIPSRWKGSCDTSGGMHCNKKLIGARYFNKGYIQSVKDEINAAPKNMTSLYQDAINSFQSARDEHDGHGTMSSSTAAGSFVPNVHLTETDKAFVKGGAPRARIAVYRAGGPEVNNEGGFSDSDVLMAVSQAIHDGVDIINLSLGGMWDGYEYFDDLVSIAGLHALLHGIVAVGSAGNTGKGVNKTGYEVCNVAPWFLTVGASTGGINITTDVVLGNNVHLEGFRFPGPGHSDFLPLISSKSAYIGHTSEDYNNGITCQRGALDKEKVRGKIVVCYYGFNFLKEKAAAVFEAGGAGAIMMMDDDWPVMIDGDPRIPAVIVSLKDSETLLSYVNQTKDPKAWIKPIVIKVSPNDTIVGSSYSSRGPNRRNPGIIKPDILAPGTVYVARPTIKPDDPPYLFLSGTSCSAPIVTGVAALVKAAHPDWSPSEIKSAIITSGYLCVGVHGCHSVSWIYRGAKKVPLASDTFSNHGDVPMQSYDSTYEATPFDVGSGNVNPNKAGDPGLVYSMKNEDYYVFLCAIGYNSTIIAKVTSLANFKCPADVPRVIDMNYPSIGVLNITETTTITRRVKNVGSPATYTVTVEQPNGVSLTVTPTTLKFKKIGDEQEYKVQFAITGNHFNNDFVFGSLTWSDGIHDVRSPIVASVASKNTNSQDGAEL